MWQVQTDEPLFPDMLWSRPERKAQAGKLLIIGGHSHGFDQVARTYQSALDAGIGEVKVILPRSLKSVLGGSIEQAVFVETTSIGSIARSSVGELLTYCQWADAVLIVQPGQSSETTLAVTELCQKTPAPLVLSDEALEAVKNDAASLLDKPDLLFVLSFAGLRQLSMIAGNDFPLMADMGLRPLILAITDWLGSTTAGRHTIVSVYDQHVIVSRGERAISTKRDKLIDVNMLASWCAVWRLQQPAKPFEALVTGVFEF